MLRFEEGSLGWLGWGEKLEPRLVLPLLLPMEAVPHREEVPVCAQVHVPHIGLLRVCVSV